MSEIEAPLIEARRVVKVFGGGLSGARHTTALDDVSLTIPAAEPMLAAVAGESGSGKSTLVLHLMGMTRPTSGQVLYQGRDLVTRRRGDRVQFHRDIQAVFQDPYDAYNPFYRVDHVLQVPVSHLKLAPSRRQGQVMIREALERVGLRPGDTLGRFPHQLSGGQRQRLMVARAWLTRPKLLLADEPVSMVDASLRATILNELRQLHQDLGVGILYITHDLTTAYQLCRTILILYRGAVVEQGTVEEVISKPKHPYTQLLVSSIPRVKGAHDWLDSKAGETADSERSSAGCRFANRCPAVMDRCWREPPPLYRTEVGSLARCFLYADRPEVTSDVAGRELASGPAANGAAPAAAALSNDKPESKD
ncbi:MAG TPA: ABC transporter ATP-binding protein [Candidatus Dormibacteraeota bacterium]|jgi:peptide/nickel transport system ATP-binding protein|nr:ABC transporter ATP-binding protein [Candidatus Dormibacteraeota bacterium]